MIDEPLDEGLYGEDNEDWDDDEIYED